MINLYANNQIIESMPEPSDFKKLDLPLNCPNCGAPIHGRSCEYCGTIFYRLAVGEDSYEQELRRLKQEEAYLKTQYAQAVQTSAILSNLQTAILVPSHESIRQSCQADQDALNRMQNQNLAASTNIYPYMTGDKVHYLTKDDPVYISNIDYNVWAPDVYGWTIIQEPVMTKETWVERFKNIFRR